MPSPLGLTRVLRDSVTQYDGGTDAQKSIFKVSENGKSNKFYYNPLGKGKNSKSSINQSESAHGGDIYNISTTSLLNYMQGKGLESMYLSSADFAYLKNLGVYPNNRLIIARRFKGPVPDDLTSFKGSPISSLVGWVEEGTLNDKLSLSFGEEWTSSVDKGLMDLLNNMLSDMTGLSISSLISSITPAGESATGTGLSNFIQFSLLKQLGFTDRELTQLPSADPNYIYAAQIRKLGGDGIKGKVTIKFETEYEQKYIPGVDPNVVFIDILNNIFRFGGSPSSFYLSGTPKKGSKASSILENFKKGNWTQAIQDTIEAFVSGMKGILEGVGDFISGIGDSFAGGDITDALSSIIDQIGGFMASLYRVRIQGVVSAMLGAPSGHWHVTLGNPKKPFFQTGDMICSPDVNITFGEVMTFNDLPSTVKVVCTLSSARDMGIQELIQKFNGSYGVGRQYKNGNLLLNSNETDVINAGSSGSLEKEAKIETELKNDSTNDPPLVKSQPSKINKAK